MAARCSRANGAGRRTAKKWYGVPGFHETNTAAWESACGQVAAARKALRTAVRRVNVGPRSGAVLASVPGLKAAVADAERARADLLAAGRGQVEVLLTNSQKTLWSAIRANPTAAGEYVYVPDLTAAQRTALDRAHAKLARRLTVARTAADRSAASAAFGRSLGTTLTATQRNALAAARANIRQHLPAVLAASRRALPPPEPDPNEAAEPLE